MGTQIDDDYWDAAITQMRKKRDHSEQLMTGAGLASLALFAFCGYDARYSHIADSLPASWALIVILLAVIIATFVFKARSDHWQKWLERAVPIKERTLPREPKDTKMFDWMSDFDNERKPGTLDS